MLLLYFIDAKAQVSYTYRYRVVLAHNPAAKAQEAITWLSNFTHPYNVITGIDPAIIELETVEKIDREKLKGKMEKVKFSVAEIKLLSQVLITTEQKAKLEELMRLREAERIAAGK